MDTIIAVATPPGRSAIGVIRMSGANALILTRSLLHEDQFEPEPAHTVLKRIRDPLTNALIDKALVTYFRAPHSFTGEDVIEISCHGSPVILRQLIDVLLTLGARLADPGEFSLRALAAGKMNLSQAEAIRDLINSQTEAACQQSLRQLNGELSARLQPLKDKLLSVIVTLESAIEFVEDDLPDVETQRIVAELAWLVSEVGRMTDSYDAGHLLRDGLKVTLAGRPNTGKSSLFNSLLRSDRAAGLRHSDDRVESMGIDRTKRAMADADLLLVVVDGSTDLTPEDFDFLALTAEQRRVIALNKSDLPEFRKQLSNEINHSPVVSVSALNSFGLDALCDAIVEPFLLGEPQQGGLLITDARHHDLLWRTQTELETSSRLIEEGANEELVLVGLHNALRFLGDITGETTTEDVLSRIFSTFCIGK